MPGEILYFEGQTTGSGWGLKFGMYQHAKS